MNAMTPVKFGAISTKFSALPPENDLSAGIEASYGLMKYKGKVFTTSYKGEDRALMRSDGTGPMASIDVVIVKAPKVKSKIFYEKGYVDGSTAAPDCWSTNGVVPDSGASKKQSVSCAGCPQNIWGSRTTEAGKKGKACQDSKRVAIVPANTTTEDVEVLRNTSLGGPMLLRIPAASLESLSLYGVEMQRANFPYQSVVTRIMFDHKEAYPKFTFAPVRPLTDAEADVVLELMGSAQVERILAEEAPVVSQGALASPAEEKPAVAFIVPQTAQVAAPAPAMAAPPPPAPVTQQVAPAAQQPQTNGFGGVSAAPTPIVGPTPGQTASASPTIAPLPSGFEAELDALMKA